MSTAWRCYACKKPLKQDVSGVDFEKETVYCFPCWANANPHKVGSDVLYSTKDLEVWK